jgi:hypothetical protein
MLAKSFYGSARTFRQDAAARARESFAFFVQRVLGLRVADARLPELLAGAPPLTKQEEKALAAKRALDEGRLSDLPPFAAWVFDVPRESAS